MHEKIDIDGEKLIELLQRSAALLGMDFVVGLLKKSIKYKIGKFKANLINFFYKFLFIFLLVSFN